MFNWLKKISMVRNVMLRSNYDERIGKIKNVIETWQFRRLTLLGKITLIKSLLVSQLIYILTPLPTYTNALQTVNKLLFEFLWDGKGDKIKREHIIRHYEQGGSRMIDIHMFNKSLKVSRDSLNLHPLPPLISFFLLGDIIYTRANLQVHLPP